MACPVSSQPKSFACVWVAVVALAACKPLDQSSEPILLFDGEGVSSGSAAAIQAILEANHLAYRRVDSSDLNRMDETALERHQLLVVPGGDFVKVGNGISKATALHIRKAVHHGLNYLGVCAGAFIAGDSPFNGLDLTNGVRFSFYSIEERGIRKTAVWITSADGTRREQYWEDGPQLSGWGEVVAKYPDGTPAVVQGTVGNGWVILTGVHPEASERWRYGMEFTTPVGVDNAYALDLIRAALDRKPLSRFH